MYFQLIFDIPADDTEGRRRRALREALTNLLRELRLEYLTPYNAGEEHPTLSREQRHVRAAVVINRALAIFYDDPSDGVQTIDDGLFLSATNIDGEPQLQLEVRGHAAALWRFVRTSGLHATRPYRRFTLIERALKRVPLLRLIYFDVRLDLLITESRHGAPTRRATRAWRGILMHQDTYWEISEVTHFVTTVDNGEAVLLEWAARTTRNVLRSPLWRLRHAGCRGPVPRWEVQLATKRVLDDGGVELIVAAALITGDATFLADERPYAEYDHRRVEVQLRPAG